MATYTIKPLVTATAIKIFRRDCGLFLAERPSFPEIPYLTAPRPGTRPQPGPIDK